MLHVLQQALMQHLMQHQRGPPL